MNFDRYLRTHSEPVGMTPVRPMRFGTATGQTYGGAVVTGARRGGV